MSPEDHPPQLRPLRDTLGPCRRRLRRAALGPLVALAAAAPLLGCNDPAPSPVRTGPANPQAGDVDLAATVAIAKLDARATDVLLRYFAGNGRWEVRVERGLRFAVRRDGPESHESSLNGFYSGNTPDLQTRVLVAFGRSYGFGPRDDVVTRVPAGSGAARLRMGSPFPRSPQRASYLIVEGAGLFLEIYEQSSATVRSFTQATLAEIAAEIADVLAHASEIETTGRLADGARYPASPAPTTAMAAPTTAMAAPTTAMAAPTTAMAAPTTAIAAPTTAIAAPTTAIAAPTLVVRDGPQPGIYQLDAHIAPPGPGVVHARVFRSSDGARLSEDRITPVSSRVVGWSNDGKGIFPYSARLTVYEGDWTTSYDARFELWFRDETGAERKLADASRLVNGWQN